jgi:hypothetical protein
VAEERPNEIGAIHDIDDVDTIDKLINHVVGARAVDLVIVVTVLDKVAELFKNFGVCKILEDLGNWSCYFCYKIRT